MSEQALDLRRSLQIVRRHKIIVGVCAALGLLAGAGYTLLNPPMLASNALVALPPSTHDMATQVVIASSDHVLTVALRQHPPGDVAASPAQPGSGQEPDPQHPLDQRPGQDRGPGGEHCERCRRELRRLHQARSKSAAGKVQAQCWSRPTNATGPVAAHSPARHRRARRPAGCADRSHHRARDQPRRPAAAGARRDSRCHRGTGPGIDPCRPPGRRRHWTRLLEDYEPSVVHAWSCATLCAIWG